MPFAFIFAGIILLAAGARGTSASLLTLLQGDLTGTNNFFYWVIAIVLIGSIGYVDELKGLSRAFLVLVIIGLILNEDKQSGTGGFFTKFNSAISSITKSGVS